MRGDAAEAAACKVIYRGVLGDGGLDGGDVVGVELHDVFKVPPNICAPVGLCATLWHIQAYLVILHESGLIRCCRYMFIVRFHGLWVFRDLWEKQCHLTTYIR